MALTANWYGPGVKNVCSGVVGWVPDTVKCSLHTSTYVPNQDTHDFFDDATNEIAGSGYTAGGVAITNKTLTYDATSNELRFDGDDASWASITATAIRYAVFRKARGGSSALDELLFFINFGVDINKAGEALSIQAASTGWAKVTAA